MAAGGGRAGPADQVAAGWPRPGRRRAERVSFRFCRVFTRRYQPVLVGEAHRLGPVSSLDLGEEVIDVALHGGFADHELRRDRGIREALRDETEHFGLTGSEATRWLGRPLRPAVSVPPSSSARSRMPVSP